MRQIHQRTWELGSTVTFQCSKSAVLKVVVIYNLLL
jgi:hypothetical protein